MLVKIVGIENAEFEVDNQTIRGQKLASSRICV